MDLMSYRSGNLVLNNGLKCTASLGAYTYWAVDPNVLHIAFEFFVSNAVCQRYK